MIKQFYCIVDAGGNPYEFTFNKTRDGSISKYIFKDFMIPFFMPCTEFDRIWKEKQENGDRVVLCDIDTKENVEIKING